MHDSYTPLGGLAAMWLMQLGEVIFGGVGSGLYGMLAFALVAVFLSGLMVGRTPEYLGKKIGAFEMKMASLVILLPCAMVLVGTAVAVVAAAGEGDRLQPRPARFQRGAVRLLLGVEQQRQRLRRVGGEHALLQRTPGPGDARRPVRGDDPDPGDRRFAGRQEAGPRRPRHSAHPHAAVRVPCWWRWSSWWGRSPSSRPWRWGRSSNTSCSRHESRTRTTMTARIQAPTFDRKVVVEAIRDSFLKLDPRTQLRKTR